MANDEEYEIMPHKTISKIKKELDSLKQKSKSMEEIATPEFKKSMDNLTKSMNSLMELFKEAAEEMKIEERTEVNIEEKLGPLIKKVNQIEEENKQIAEGIVTVADMVKELRQKVEMKSEPRPMMPPLIQQKKPPVPQLRQAPMQPPRTGKPIPPPKFEQMAPPRPMMPQPMPAFPPQMREQMPMPPRPPSFAEGFEMPPPPAPPEKKKKSLFDIFKKQ